MSCIVLDCLLPNSIIVPISCSDDTELWKLKNALWQEAKKYPFYKSLEDPNCYLFVGVSPDGHQHNFLDEDKKIRELKLFSPFLKVLEKQETHNEKAFNVKLARAIGRSISDFDAKDEEIQTFRKSILKVVEGAVASRQQDGMTSLACYQHPPELEPSPHLLQSVMDLLINGMLQLRVWHSVTECVTVTVPWDIFPEVVISEALKHGYFEAESPSERGYVEGVAKYALKICGTDEYLMARRPITQYRTIRRWIVQKKVPQLCLVFRGELYASLTKFNFSWPSICAKDNDTLTQPSEPTSLWHPSMEGRFKIHILSAKLPFPTSHRTFVRVGLFHGGEPLSILRETHLSTKASWDEWIQLDLPIQEMPRAAKLCFALCCRSQEEGRKKKKEDVMIAYGNLHIFDFKGRLIHGQVLVPLMEKPPGIDDLIYPQGLQVLDRKDFHLEVNFEQRFVNVQFPDESQMYDYARYVIKLSQPEKRVLLEGELIQIKSISDKDPLYTLSLDDKVFLWAHRHHCLRIPDSLPKLASAVNWSCRDQVSQFYFLLDDWPLVSAETALELLQFTFPDPKVREHAVISLSRTLPDEKLAQYLLQLVYSLKHEIYLDSPLLCFLLHKGLTNKTIGYLLYWHVRSESIRWPGSQRAFAILEAYCRGLGPDLKALLDQVEMVETMTRLADRIKEQRNDINKDGTKYLQHLLSKGEYNSALQHLPSPLNPGLILGRLRVSECKVLDSARKPIYLTWENSDPMASRFFLSHALIFKSGDDLRQDMLTLQVVAIMAQAWNAEGLDLCMTPYSCLVTGNKVGLIEVVQNAKTVYSIQKRAKLGAFQFDSSQLFKWIKDKNPGDRLEHAIETFRRSCAGYCVATFVLGIGDRHPDNIMVNEEGQIFHIDFGHFLGNFKKKFGFQRERVPFVLTQDFLKVIASGSDNPKESIEFQRFQELCGNAYLGLRKHTHLILSLFALLISTGLPELQSLEDASYLKQTLAVGLSEAEALQYFQNRLHEAYDGAWTTKLDWFFHSVKHR